MTTPDNISRPYYLKKIEPFARQNLIKVLTGQRRVGKSFLLRQLMDNFARQDPGANIIFVDKEKYAFDPIRTYADLVEHCQARIVADRDNYIFIDEVQDVQDFEKALRHLYALPRVDLYCSGSNANMLSGELATTLSGRYVELKVFSLSYKEFLDFHRLPDAKDSLDRYLRVGGLPYLVHLRPDEEVVFEYLRNIASTIIYKDIIKRNNIRNFSFLENLVAYLALNTGNLISAKKISDFLKSQNLKMSPQIVIDYLGSLRDAFLVHKVQRSDLHGKQRFAQNEKYYFEDIGLKNVLAGIDNFQINQVLENVVFNHLLMLGYEISVGISGDKEIDFVCSKPGKKLYVQVAYLLSDPKVMEREFGNLAALKDNYPKLVISLDDYAPNNVQGIKHLHLRKFLLNFEEHA